MKLYTRRWSWARKAWEGLARTVFNSTRQQFGHDMEIYIRPIGVGTRGQARYGLVIAWENRIDQIVVKDRKRYQYVRIELSYHECRRIENALSTAFGTRHVRKDAYTGRRLTRLEARYHKYPGGPGRRRPGRGEGGGRPGPPEPTGDDE